MFIIVVRGLVMGFPGNSQAFGGNLYGFSASCQWLLGVGLPVLNI